MKSKDNARTFYADVTYTLQMGLVTVERVEEAFRIMPSDTYQETANKLLNYLKLKDADVMLIIRTIYFK